MENRHFKIIILKNILKYKWNSHGNKIKEYLSKTFFTLQIRTTEINLNFEIKYRNLFKIKSEMHSSPVSSIGFFLLHCPIQNMYSFFI